MMWFRKSQKIPEEMVDIHNHLLPGIDDGAVNWEVSMEMMLALEHAGFSKVAVSPHRFHPLFPENVTFEEVFFFG